jgi:hypothetical protein
MSDILIRDVPPDPGSARRRVGSDRLLVVCKEPDSSRFGAECPLANHVIGCFATLA